MQLKALTTLALIGLGFFPNGAYADRCSVIQVSYSGVSARVETSHIDPFNGRNDTQRCPLTPTTICQSGGDETGGEGLYQGYLLDRSRDPQANSYAKTLSTIYRPSLGEEIDLTRSGETFDVRVSMQEAGVTTISYITRSSSDKILARGTLRLSGKIFLYGFDPSGINAGGISDVSKLFGPYSLNNNGTVSKWVPRFIPFQAGSRRGRIVFDRKAAGTHRNITCAM